MLTKVRLGNLYTSLTSTAKAEQVAQEIKQDGGEAIAVAGDVTDPKFGDNVVNAAVEKYGKLNHIVKYVSTRTLAPV